MIRYNYMLDATAPEDSHKPAALKLATFAVADILNKVVEQTIAYNQKRDKTESNVYKVTVRIPRVEVDFEEQVYGSEVKTEKE